MAAPATILHGFTRCRVVGADNSLDYVEVPAACNIVKAFPDLGWVDGPTPGYQAAPMLALSFCSCAAATADWDTAAIKALLDLSELLVAPTLTFMQQCADGMDALGVYDKVYRTTEVFIEAAELAVQRAPVPSPFEMSAGSLVETTTFLNGGAPAVAAVLGQPAVPAIRAVPAVRAGRGRAAVRAVRAQAAQPAIAAVAGRLAVPPSGPDELRWFHLVRVGHRLDRAHSLPLLRLWQLGLVLTDRLSVAARNDATSRTRDVLGILEQHLRADLGAAAEPGSIARHFQRSADRLFTLPDELRSFSFRTDVAELEFLDDLKYGGDQATKDGVVAGRLEFIGAAFPTLHEVLSRCGSRAAKVATINRLVVVLSSAEQKQPLFSKLDPLDVFLSARSQFLTQCWNKGLPLEGPDGVISLTLRETEEWRESKDVDGKNAQSLNDDDLLGGGTTIYTESALRRALIEDELFVKAAEEILALDLTLPDAKKEAVEIASLAKCTIFQIFFGHPKRLLKRHPVFTALHGCFESLPTLFGQAQATLPPEEGGGIAKTQENWTYDAEQCILAYRATVTSLYLFDMPYGSHALHNLTLAQTLDAAPAHLRYVLKSALELIGPFAQATFVTAGWAAIATDGYTMKTLFERQLAHVKWIEGLALEVQGDLRVHAQANFEAGLRLTQSHMQRLLDSPEPSQVKLSCVLPFGTSFDKALKEKVDAGLPLVGLQKAFPGLLSAAATRPFPGTESSSASKPAASGGGDRGQPKAEDKTKKPGATPPGSRADLASWEDDTHMRMGPLIYDVEAIAKEYKLTVADMCWPVLLTVKKGAESLCACAQWGKPGHTALTSSAHQKPKKWNVDTIEKKFTTKAPSVGGKRKAAK